MFEQVESRLYTGGSPKTHVEAGVDSEILVGRLP